MKNSRTWNKYNAKKSIYLGRVFHSKKEASIAKALDMLIEKGKVHAWFPQISFHLRGFDGKFLGKKYVCDFLVFKEDETKEGEKILKAEVWDVKGFLTQSYLLKKEIITCQGINIIDNLDWGEGYDGLANSGALTSL